MKDIQIRKVKENELEQLINLCELHAIYEGVNYDKRNKVEKLCKELFRNNASLICLVAVKNDELLGYTSFLKEFSTWDADNFLYMDCLYLNENSRGYGIGKMFMSEIIKYKEKLNCTHIQWQTPSSNIKAINFYKNLGAISKDKNRFFLY